MPWPPGGACGGAYGRDAAGAAGSLLLRSLSRVQLIPPDRVPADRPDDAQSAEAVHHLPRSARAGAAARAAGMQRLPRPDRAPESPVTPREPSLCDVPHRPAGAQGEPACRPSDEAHGPGLLRSVPRQGGHPREGGATDRPGDPLPALPVLAMPLPTLPRDAMKPDEDRAPDVAPAAHSGPERLDRRQFVEAALKAAGAAAPLLVAVLHIPVLEGQEAGAAGGQATTRPVITTGWASTSRSALAAAAASPPARRKTTSPPTQPTSIPGSSATSSTWTAR